MPAALSPGSSLKDLQGLSEVARSFAVATDAPFGAYLFGPQHPGSLLARAVEREVFDQSFGNDGDLLEREYGCYEPVSVFFVLLDHRRMTPAGMTRLIVPNDAPGLKSLNDLAPTWCVSPDELLDQSPTALDRSVCFDWATLAVHPEYRAAGGLGLVSMGLYQSVVRTMRALGGKHAVALLDLPVYRMLRLRFAQPYVAIGPPRPYLGSARTVPALLDLNEWEARLRLVDPDLCEIIFDAQGIEAAVHPLDIDTAGLVAAELKHSATNR